MSQSVHQIVIQGQDRTRGAFSSVASNASRLSGLMRTAFAGIGAYMSFRAIKDGIVELGHLSDIAMKTGTSAEQLTALSTALEVLGIQNVSIDALGRSFDYMQKKTGRTGMQGFLQTIEEIAAIEDPAKRAQKAVEVFGRSGAEFLPLIRGAAENGIEPLRNVIAAMPGISDAAATQGDAVSDSMTILTAGVKTAWLDCIGVVCGAFDNQFTGGVREAAEMASNWLVYYANVGTQRVVQVWSHMQDYLNAIYTGYGAIMGGESIGDAFAKAREEWMMASAQHDTENADINKRIADWREAAEKRAETIRKHQDDIAKAAVGGSGAGAAAEQGEKAKRGAARRETEIRNALVGASSNEARRMALLGPKLSSADERKQKALDTIAKNTSQMVKNQSAADEADAAANSDIGTLEAN